MNKYLRLLAITGVILSLDQLTKLHVHYHFLLGESVDVIPGFFNITYVRNPGAAFGFLANAPAHFRDNFFLIMPPLAGALILFILRGLKREEWLQLTAYSLVFAGAIGNYIDRVRLGYVIDFLDFHYGKWAWPAFNVADSAIVVGISFLFVLMIFESSFNKQPQT